MFKRIVLSVVPMLCMFGTQQVSASDKALLPDIGVESRMCADKIGKKCKPPGSEIECSIKDDKGKIIGGFYLLCIPNPDGPDGVVTGVGKTKKEPRKGKVTNPGQVILPPIGGQPPQPGPVPAGPREGWGPLDV